MSVRPWPLPSSFERVVLDGVFRDAEIACDHFVRQATRNGFLEEGDTRLGWRRDTRRVTSGLPVTRPELGTAGISPPALLDE